MLKELKRERRDRLQIICDILISALSGALKTELIYKVGLSSAQGEKYISMLIRSKLLEKKEGRSVYYRTTGNGMVFLRSFMELAKLLDDGRRH